ncbi:SpoIIIAC/SpoIIIAD family protein [Anaeromicropila herbilytica]|uniref:Stage III sporulation protein AD n=1 Tax=Anaeromicropila herbilytica TaxID=2785025 RepID=A0A7R7ICX1_9FIRM|nr:stage III sporulation protein AD [Anaeromicropila herbilytica]
MVKIALIGIVAVLIATYFKVYKAEYSIYIGIVASILIIYFGISKLNIIMNTIREIEGFISINHTYLEILIKIIGITYIAEFSSSLCKDAGHAAIANQIELVGKLTILTISMPILLALLDTINEFLHA